MKLTLWAVLAVFTTGQLRAELPPPKLIPLSEHVMEMRDDAGTCRHRQTPNGDPTVQDLSGFSTTGSLTIDFSKPTQFQKPMNGLFLGLGDLNGANAIPPYLVQMLVPQLWTTSPQKLDTVLSFGASPLLLLGAQPYWDNSDSPPPPYVRTEGTKFWRSALQDFVAGTFGKGGTWAGWNEPDCQYEWSQKKFKGGTMDERKENTFQTLFDTYKLSYQTMKDNGGDQENFGGLAWNAYNRDVIATFLEYALQENLEVRTLVWHELGQSANNLPLIQAHIEDARRTFIDNKSKYGALKLERIVINESVTKQSNGALVKGLGCDPGQYCYYPPGEVLATKYFAEQGGADKLSVTNFLTKDSDGSLGSRFTPGSFEPRGFGWAERLYADLGTKRVPCGSTNQQIKCFATPSSAINGLPQILVAYYGPPEKAAQLVPITMALNLKAPFGAGVTEGWVRIEMINKVDTSSLPSLPRANYQLKNEGQDNWTLTLPKLERDQAMLISPIAGPASGTKVNVAYQQFKNKNGARGTDCSYLVDPSGEGILLGCNNQGEFKKTVVVTTYPNQCQILRVMMVTGSQPWPLPFKAAVLRDTARITAPNGQPEKTYSHFTRDGNVFKATMNDDEDFKKWTREDGYRDMAFSLTVPTSNYTIQNSGLPCK